MSIENARERAARLEALFENSPLPQLECDAAGHVVTCNRAAERALGMSHDEMAGRAFASFIGRAQAADRTLSAAHGPASQEIEIRGRGGELRRCTASLTPLPAPEGMKPGFAVTLSGLDVPAEVK
jgi:PAS domain S-box-containing protein